MKLPLLSGREVLAALQRLGFARIHGKGSHVKMKHADGRVIVFPYHDEVDRYTLKGALRDADVAIEEFLRKVKCICFEGKTFGCTFSWIHSFDYWINRKNCCAPVMGLVTVFCPAMTTGAGELVVQTAGETRLVVDCKV